VIEREREKERRREGQRGRGRDGEVERGRHTEEAGELRRTEQNCVGLREAD
jgi:hypothetical protein